MHPVLYCDNKEYEEHLFIDYYKHIILNDNHLADTFLLIGRHLKRICSISEDLLYDKNEELVKKIDIPVKDRLGYLRTSSIVKKINISKNVYEIRINEQYLKHRVLFFPLDRETKSILILTFGFAKEENFVDLTDPLSIETQGVYEKLIEYKLIEEIIGEAI